MAAFVTFIDSVSAEQLTVEVGAVARVRADPAAEASRSILEFAGGETRTVEGARSVVVATMVAATGGSVTSSTYSPVVTPTTPDVSALAAAGWLVQQIGRRVYVHGSIDVDFNATPSQGEITIPLPPGLPAPVSGFGVATIDQTLAAPAGDIRCGPVVVPLASPVATVPVWSATASGTYGLSVAFVYDIGA